MVMLKDNHIWARGGDVTAAILAARAAAGFSVKIEVECQSLDEAIKARTAGADIVMLDNFTPAGAKDAAEYLKKIVAPLSDSEEVRYQGRNVLVEISGGLTEENIADFVSEGGLLLSPILNLPSLPSDVTARFLLWKHISLESAV